GSGDAQLVEAADGLLAWLPPIEACARTRHVEAAGYADPRPVAPEASVPLRRRMLTAIARAELDRVEQALEDLRQLLREVEVLDDPSLRLQLMIALARVEQLAGHAPQARQRLEQVVS